LDFELLTISNSYPGYFLIVQDFIAKAREMDVSVGPGRGSAVGHRGLLFKDYQY
jgi:DNA polymerase-3 subunit alpha